MTKLYIADDNVEFAQYLATVAEGQGWAVDICENGRVLLEKLNAGSGPALLIIDINMPEVDGIEAIEGVADVDRPLRVRFVSGAMETTLVAANLIAEARNIAVGRSIFKPVALADLKALLRDEWAAIESLTATAP